MPDYSKGYWVGSTFTAPEDGWIYCYGNGRRSTTVNGREVLAHQLEYGGDVIGNQSMGAMFPISKGETYSNNWAGISALGWAMFYPCK